MPMLLALLALSLLPGGIEALEPDDESTSCLQVRQVQEAESNLDADLDAKLDADLDADLDANLDAGLDTDLDADLDVDLDADRPCNKNRPHPAGGGSDLDLRLLLDDHHSECSTVFMTTVFGTRRDPQRGEYKHLDFAYIERYYRSILALPGGRAKAVILHDNLPEDLVHNFTNPDGAVSFVKVDLTRFEKRLGLNDLRFQLFEEQVKQHPEWDTVFMTDGHDVVVVHNPCVLVERQPDKVFVGSQSDSLKPRVWFFELFGYMGGKYEAWYAAQPNNTVAKLNAGILGGKRSVVLKSLEKLNAVLFDPELEQRKKGGYVAVNMAAFNYVFRGELAEDVVTGYPLHSQWNKYENRTDVYFWHH